METKKSPKASLENKRVLFAEVGMILALLAVLGAFSYSTREHSVASLTPDLQVDDVVEIVPITMETPPPPPSVSLPVLSDQIEIVEDEIQVEDFFSIEDTKVEFEIRDYVEEVKEEEIVEETIDFVRVEEKPRFNNGDANTFSRWVAEHLVYPEIAKENGVQGRVILQFTILRDGTLGNVKLLRGVDGALDKEAMRVVSQSPKWEPGRQRDRAVNVTYTFPVIFQLRCLHRQRAQRYTKWQSASRCSSSIWVQSTGLGSPSSNGLGKKNSYWWSRAVASFSPRSIKT